MGHKEQTENWSKLYGKPISETEYKEICDNLYGFFSVLHKWDEAEKKSAKNERNSDNRNKYIPSQA